ncbi:MAG: hypothetical protein QM662_05160 [Gordonia sp. (in: high G+C Gram-positive bacteria)]
MDAKPGKSLPPAPAESAAAEPPPVSFGERLRHWGRMAIFALIGVVAAVIVYFILAAAVPREWAEFIRGRTGGSLLSGSFYGVVLGLVCTAVPLIAWGFGILYRKRLKNIPSLVLAAIGVVVAIPNLLTLGVVLGTGNGAHAGQRIFDVEAPGFRAGSAWGAIVGAVLAVGIAYFVWRYRRRGKRLRAATQTEPAES